MTQYRVAEPQAQWLTSQVAAGAASSEEAYLARLIDADREQAEKLAAFNAAINEGFASGTGDLTIDEIFTEARRRHGEAAEAASAPEDDENLTTQRAEIAKGRTSGVSPRSPDQIFASVIVRHDQGLRPA